MPQLCTFIVKEIGKKKPAIETSLHVLAQVKKAFLRKFDDESVEEGKVVPETIFQGQNTVNVEKAYMIIEDHTFPSTFESSLQRLMMCDFKTARLWIEEYRKFICLQACNESRLVPSSKVERIWLHHITYMDDYARMI